MALDPRTDAELLQCFQARGDRAALSALFERHRGLAYRVALGVLRDPADAEDAAQNAFLNIILRAPEVRSEGSLSGLIARATLRAAHDLIRASGRRRDRERAVAIAEDALTPGPFEEVARRERQRALLDALAGLTERYRLPVVLHYLEGLSTTDTAEALGISQSAVTTRLSRAVGQLRARLRPSGVLLPGTGLVALLKEQVVEAAPAAFGARMEVAAASAPVAVPVAGIATSMPAIAATAGGLLTAALSSGAAAKLAAAGLVVAVSLGGAATYRRMALPSGASAQGVAARASNHVSPQPDTSARHHPAAAAILPDEPAPTRGLPTTARSGARRDVESARTSMVASATESREERGPSMMRRGTPPIARQLGRAEAPAARTALRPPTPKREVGLPVPVAVLAATATAEGQDPLARIMAPLRVREDAIERVRGWFTYEKLESASHSNQLATAYPEQAVLHNRRDDDTRTVCVGEFIAGPALLRLDGTMLNDGGANRWGIVSLPGQQAPAEPDAAGLARAQPGRLRTLVVRDGQHETVYSDSLASQTAKPQALMGNPAAQPPLSEWLFCTSGGEYLSHRLSAKPEGLSRGVKCSYRPRYTGRVEIGVVPCVRVEVVYRTSDAAIPGGIATYWLAERMGHAPVMSIATSWEVKGGRAQAWCYFWLAEEYQELGTTDPPIALPGGVRIQTALGYPPDRIDWAELERCEFLGLEVNPPMTRGAITRWAPPLGTASTSHSGSKRPNEAFQREQCWQMGQRLLNDPGKPGLNPQFRRLILEALQAGPPAPLPQ